MFNHIYFIEHFQDYLNKVINPRNLKNQIIFNH